MTIENVANVKAQLVISESALYVQKFLQDVQPKERAAICKELVQLLKDKGAMAR